MAKPSIHLIGVGGTGMSAIARVLLESGSPVTGSDRQLSALAHSLQDAGMQVFIGHQPENVHGAQVVVRSSAVPDDNPEVQEARRLGIPVLKRADFLGQLMAGRTGIAVAGSHGKTTTTAMIAWMLTALGHDPSYIIGGVSVNLGSNAHAGKGSYFVIEADEYDRMFLGLRPTVAVVTNIEHDHPDCYPTPEDFHQAFVDFVGCLTPDGVLLACGDDLGAARLLRQATEQGRRALAYGMPGMHYAYYASNLVLTSKGMYTFDVVRSTPPDLLDAATVSYEPLAGIALRVPGRHNVLNSLAALAVADVLGLPVAEAAQALSEYRGTGRRFDVRGEVGGVTIIDDYAHHPTHIRAALSAARDRYPSQSIWAVWQPHTYSRTRALLEDYAVAFDLADHVVITEVYPAREPLPADKFSARKVLSAMRHPDAHFADTLHKAMAVLLARLQPGDVLLVLSAGDADQISDRLLVALEDDGPLPRFR